MIVKEYVNVLTAAIDNTMSAAYRRPGGVFVANIVLCHATPFYGYHAKSCLFLKIYLLSPFYQTKLSELFLNGKILGRCIQPFESHIPFLLQFLTDFNVVGTGTLSIWKDQAYFVNPAPKEIPESRILDSVSKIGNSFLEIHIDASAIANRTKLKQRDLGNEASGRLIPSLTELWTDEGRRRHNEGEASFAPPENPTQKVTSTPPWRRFDELKTALIRLIQNENEFDFEESTDLTDTTIPSSFEAVGSMFKPVVETSLVSKIVKLDIADETTDMESDYEDDNNENANEDDQMDPLSQAEKELYNEDLPEKTGDADNEVGESLCKPIILQETVLQNSILKLIHSNPEAGKTILSQSQQHSLKRKNTFSVKEGQFFASTKRADDDFFDILSWQSTNSQSNSNSPGDRFKVAKLAVPYDPNSRIWYPRNPAPTVIQVQSTMKPTEISKKPFYSDIKDVPIKPIVIAGQEFVVKTNKIGDLPLFRFYNDLATAQLMSLYQPKINGVQLKYQPMSKSPPSYNQVSEWVKQKKLRSGPDKISQLGHSVSKTKYGFKYATQKQLTSNRKSGQSYLSVLDLELHVNTRQDKVPDPDEDAICAIFYGFQSELVDTWNDDKNLETGIVIFCDCEKERKKFESSITLKNTTVLFANSELEIINTLIKIVKTLDPDVLSGYEVNNKSWGYLFQRSKSMYDYDVCDLIGRVTSNKSGKYSENKWAATHTSAITVVGRHVFNIWRILRNEINLNKYTLENVVFHTIHHRLPFYEYQTLTKWFKSISATERALSIRYHLDRVIYSIKIINNQELITRTCEQARIVGIDFYSVFYRGSQYKVEAILARLTKAENFLMISPSRKQVGEQNALECLPLIMEPDTRMYTSPVVVLDFQSLYPSIMIAYNYCYSTCLGRINRWRGRNKLGFTDLNLPSGLLKSFEKDITIAPNGMIYVKPNNRKSLLAKMLTEILDTRVMIKDGMSSNKSNASFQKLMNNRQLALKLIANVTYGYTSASFSGRMPCVEIADSIVQSGRETLEAAIDFIQKTPRWGAEVVYGDTDSLFVHLPGRSKDQAFAIGREIAEEITAKNPPPIKLKFEKIYFPCILQTKKRYVGNMYETESQINPVFDAKGTETVRRDGTPVLQEIEHNTLSILFNTRDLSKVKTYLISQWTHVLSGAVNIEDFCFAKEVKLGTYKGIGPPGAKVAINRIAYDAKATPQHRERIPYVVVSGAPGSRLIDRCVDPRILLETPGMYLDAEYYIVKHLIPPLDRILSLVGTSAKRWFEEMPRPLKPVSNLTRLPMADFVTGPLAKTGVGMTMETYLKKRCVICGVAATSWGLVASTYKGQICANCNASRTSLGTMATLEREKSTRLEQVVAICKNCGGESDSQNLKCVSLDCKLFYERSILIRDYKDW